MTEAEADHIAHLMLGTSKRSKYGNRKVMSPDGLFDSQAELRRWNELVLMQAAGEIVDLIRQPVYRLSDQPAVRYTPDFQYEEAGRVVVEDVKGAVSRDVSVRIAWLRQRWPWVTVRLLRQANSRRAVKRGWRAVAGWEVKEMRGG